MGNGWREKARLINWNYLKCQEAANIWMNKQQKQAFELAKKRDAISKKWLNEEENGVNGEMIGIGEVKKINKSSEYELS